MKLVVLAGAKKNAAVPLKKDRFVIGRAKECSLRAGSDAISRRHCEIATSESGAIVRDLGSRNGTFVNDERIEGDRPLAHGDRLRVGPLEFRFESEGQLSEVKLPKVESVGQAVSRSAERSASDDPKNFEDSISDWLIGDGADTGQAVRETMSFHTDETRAIVSELTEEASDDAEAESPEEGDKKAEPGKLPQHLLDKNKAKDSREAATQILRDMARRR